MADLYKDKIIVITHEISNSGAPLLACKIVEELKKTGYQVCLINLRKCKNKINLNEIKVDDYYLIDEFSDFVKLLEKIESAIYNKNGIFKFVHRLIKIIKSKKRKEIKVIRKLYKKGYRKAIINTVVSSHLSEILTKNNIKNITLIHEMSANCILLNAKEKIETAFNYTDKLIFPSTPVLDDFSDTLGVKVEKYAIIPQGFYKKINFDNTKEENKKKIINEFNLPENARIFVGAGTITPTKGVDLLPLIYNNLKQKENVFFIWLGEEESNSYSVHLKRQIVKMNLQEKIFFTGFIGDEQKYCNIIRAAEAFLLTSREDSMPSVMIEAMIAKTLVIAFEKSGGASELLSNNRGFLVPYMDINRFAKDISQIINKEIDIDTIVKEAYKYVEKHMRFDEYVKKLIKELNY